MTSRPPCQPIKQIVYTSVSHQIMGLTCSYVPINLDLCILLCVKIIVQVCAFIGTFSLRPLLSQFAE